MQVFSARRHASVAGQGRAARQLAVQAKAVAAPASASPAVSAPAHFDINGKAIPVPSDVAPLFTPVKVGRFELSNRIAYAPLTRLRAVGGVPAPQAALYYSQRTVKGTLLISEATNITQEGQGYPNSPGIWSEEQIQKWQPVTQAVNDKGGVFFLQLWHTGRASHPEFQPDGAAPFSSSEVPITSPEYQVFTSKGPQPYPVPRAMTKDDIKRVVQDYVKAARNALAAGFDGVEIHSANGYLLDQFIKDSVNKRTDEYGGSIENRCRFALEVVEAVCNAVGADRVGIRITPFTTFLDAIDSTPYATHTYLAEKLNAFGLAYVHMVEPRVIGAFDGEHSNDTLEPFRKVYRGTFITAGGFNRASGAQALAQGQADLVAYGRWYLSNPDLHKRFLLNAPLTPYNRDTFYSSGMEGYIDYPFLDEQQ